ncbi:MAG: hypothetical protein JKY50_00475 [Oleispira sp.]|nr:hypothetical protein [Oleispira sp.]
MKRVNTRDFRYELSMHLNRIIETNEPLLVTAPNRDVVILSKAQYDIMQEQIKGVSDA